MPRPAVDTARPLGSPRGGLRSSALFARAFLVAVAVAALALLAACGAPESGGPLPPTIEYVFSATAQVPAGEFDENSLVWFAEATGFSSPRDVQSRWFGSYQIAADGTALVEVDARDMMTDLEPLDPRDFLDYALLGQSVEYTVSDPAARWKFLRNGWVFQRDVVTDTADLYSHNVSASTQIGQQTYISYAVFSDKPVTVTSTLSEDIGGPRYTVDVELQAGWNILSRQFADNTFTVRSRPVEGTEELSVRAALQTLGNGTDEVARGFAVVTQHELAASEPGVLHSIAWTTSSVNILVPTWLSSRADNPSLAPMQDAFPGLFTAAGVTVDPPEARGAVAAVFAFDSAATSVSGWASDLTAAIGEVDFTSSAGVRLWHIYADRTTTLTLDLEYLTSARLRTGAIGLTLDHGWNMVEVRPDGPDMYYLIRTHDVPTSWTFLPR